MKKLDALKNILLDMKNVLIAYSNGVDSTFLLKIAYDILGDKVLAVTANSLIRSDKELEEAKNFTKMLGIKHIIINTDELDNIDFIANTIKKCYYCKKELFSELVKLAREYNIKYIIEGSNYDDIDDFRPGMLACSELGIRSPLKEAKLTKKEIRKLSKEMNLSTWDKPNETCFATRFPYDVKLTKEEISKVKVAEEFLENLGIKQLRVRVHHNIIRIEVLREDMYIFIDEILSNKIVKKFKEIGYTYITLDIQGYRIGSMNEPLKLAN